MWPSARCSPDYARCYVPSKLDDPPQKIGFVDDKWFVAEGGRGIAEASDSAVYLAIALRNVGAGIAVLHGWHFHSVRSSRA